MTNKDVENLAEHGTFNDEKIKAKIIETHISWVLLSEKFAFKIKKPLKLSFLDFSSLDKRKYYCFQELSLNQRFTNIYLNVLPINKVKNQFCIDGIKGKTIDYAVQMKRLDENLRMDKMAQNQKISKKNIIELGKTIANFHKTAVVIDPQNIVKKLGAAFNNLYHLKNEISNYLGQKFENIVVDITKFSNDFLDKNQLLITERGKKGWIRDLHGDLHMQNIFLQSPPILFDCIEFNLDFRQIDVLSEIAFLCMDLEFNNFNKFSSLVLKTYLEELQISLNDKEISLFNYYKLYRANVRAKVNLIRLNFDPTNETIQNSVKRYLLLCEKYYK